jgi:hypothetical protein
MSIHYYYYRPRFRGIIPNAVTAGPCVVCGSVTTPEKLQYRFSIPQKTGGQTYRRIVAISICSIATTYPCYRSFIKQYTLRRKRDVRQDQPEQIDGDVRVS